MARAELTQERLKQVLSYDPYSGEFTWIGSTRDGWNGKRAGCLKETGYRSIRIDGRAFLEERLAFLYMTGEWPTDQVDHRDLDSANNAWDNIRDASFAQNNANRRAYCKSGLKGAYRDKRDGRWFSHISVNKQIVQLGTFATAEDAHVAYASAAKLYYGEFARTE